jgi:hypothetical protein
MTRRSDPPVVLVKWYDFTKWVLGHVDNFPKNQRFVFGQRLADGVITILELIVEATYSERKSQILLEVNRRLEVLRWLLRLAFDRRLLASKQYASSSEQLTECGRMIGGWYKQAVAKEGSIGEASQGAI